MSLLLTILSTDASPQHTELRDHAVRPRNQRSLAAPNRRGFGSNALCGDRVEVMLTILDNHIVDAAFKGRGCSVCIASASLMTELVRTKTTQEVCALSSNFRCWAMDDDSNWNPPSALGPLTLVRGRPARRQCLVLAWEALSDALG